MDDPVVIDKLNLIEKELEELSSKLSKYNYVRSVLTFATTLSMIVMIVTTGWMAVFCMYTFLVCAFIQFYIDWNQHKFTTIKDSLLSQRDILIFSH